MTLENDSVFTTIGWDGNKSVFALDEHLIRLEKHANIAGIKFDKEIELEIKKNLKNKEYKKINTNNKIKCNKPNGLITIRLNRNREVILSERDNEYNKKCEKIKAITVDVSENLKNNRGIKLGEHLPYKNSLKIAKKFGGNAALIVENSSIIDGDRATLMILDKDGTAWVSSNKYGSVQSITIDLIKDKLIQRGIPIIYGRITTDLILRASDAIMLGTGLGVTRIYSIDDRVFEFTNSILFENASSAFEEIIQEKWIDLDGVETL
tara:strand:- start:29663 stop:30457 length:795 start_codon:yes stop_codon:yes gene_type:complete